MISSEDRNDYDEREKYDRWYQLRYHYEQQRYWTSTARFNFVPAGRRSGKTEIAKRRLVKRAFSGPEDGGSWYPDARYFAAAPTRDQAKRIFWKDLKLLIPPEFRSKAPSESQLIIYTVFGSEIHVLGMDKPERIEGTPWDGGILDEYGNMRKEAWGEHVRPALSDRKGWCDLIGVPEGRNHYYKEYKRALADRSGIRRAFHWISADILPADEIEEAKKDLDELTYQQEYEASFVNFSGRTYWAFLDKTHVANLIDQYNPKAPLLFMFDFNIAPGVAAIGQEMKLPTRKNPIGTGLIGEVWIPRGSNTEMVCDKLYQQWKKHQGDIYCYGDATGGAKGSAKVRGSDWQIIQRKLFHYFDDRRVHFRVPNSNPRERDRVNAVNSRLLNTSKEIRLMVDARCQHIIEDFEGVICVEGGSGEIDKKFDTSLTHLTDAIGYYCHREFPVKREFVSSGQRYWK